MSRERSQQIRPTQFLTSYGPGAILDTLNGPRLLVSFTESGVFTGARGVEEFEIVEPALSQLLPEKGRIFRLPTNADFDLSDDKVLYETHPFPRWSLCPSHGLVYQRKDTTSFKACPKCPKFASSYQAWQRSREQAVSFVMACTNGHLDDVSWSFLIHQKAGKPDCKSETLIWKGAGGPLKEVTLECPKCQAQSQLSALYHQEHSCSGRFLETGDLSFGSCDKKARISQRAASDLYLPEIRTALTLPYLDSPLHDALRYDTIFVLVEREFRAAQELSQVLWEELLSGSRIPVEIKETILSAELACRNEAAKQVLKESQTTHEQQARANELRVLLEASRDGTLRSRNFELDVSGARELPLEGLRLRVTPVPRLRMTAAQIGYRRMGGELVDTGHRVRGELWYPGVELFGEGLFFELLSPPNSNGPRWRAWNERAEAEGEVSRNPLMVWWHTLSHRLIRALAIHSGYSAASVRERLYLDQNQGGLLIYAVQPGGDGTLGGLIALVPRFERLLQVALQGLDCCSNDPLCEEQKVSATRQNGAACYACCLLSETSCEMRNRSLDRSLLLETIHA